MRNSIIQEGFRPSLTYHDKTTKTKVIPLTSKPVTFEEVKRSFINKITNEDDEEANVPDDEDLK